MILGVNATFLSSKTTGVGNFTISIIREILKLHPETVVFAPGNRKDIKDPVLERVPVFIQGSTYKINNILRFLYLNTLLAYRCKKKQVDVLYCPVAEFPLKRHLPTIIQIHDLHPLYFPEQFGLAARAFKTAIKRLHRCADLVLVSSEYTRKELLKYTEVDDERVKVVYLAYDDKRFYPRAWKHRSEFLKKYSIPDRYILFVGSLFEYKNTKTLINAFIKIKKKIPHLLIIIGRTDVAQTEPVKDERIRYFDYVPSEDLPFFYSFADAFVFPSLSEGFGIAPLEAMACGTPVISSSRASLPEVLGDAAVYFDPLNTEEIQVCILKVLESSELRKKMRDKGLKNVKRYSWTSTARAILMYCHNIM